MRRPASAPVASVALLVALLALAHAQYPLALCAMVLRAAVVSFDNPTTQYLDEAASQALPHSDPGRQASETLALRPAPPGLLMAQATGWYNPTLRGSITRSPPASPLP